MLEDFFIRALLGGIGVAIIAGPFGCFVVWQKMSYFGATIAHAALLGVALGFLFDVAPLVTVLIVSILVALGIIASQRQHYLASDTVLGVFAHTALAMGVLLLGFMETLRVDLIGYLFGDILAIGNLDLLLIYLGATVAYAVFFFIWRPLLAMTVHEELALAEGMPVQRTRYIFSILLALVIAISMKIIGVLLIVSMLIIPAAAARYLARTPEQMAVISIIFGILAVIVGLSTSLFWDTASGPSIIIVAFAILVLVQVIKKSKIYFCDSNR